MTNVIVIVKLMFLTLLGILPKRFPGRAFAYHCSSVSSEYSWNSMTSRIFQLNSNC